MLNANYVYNLPFFAKATGLAHSLLGGWELAGTFIDETGLNSAGQQPGSRPFDQLRPSRSGRRLHQPPEHQRKGELPEEARKQWFNTAQFSAPMPAWLGGPNQGFGNAGKDSIVGPGRVNFTTSLYKSFAMTERAHFELRFESFNTFNHTELQRFQQHTRRQPVWPDHEHVGSA